MPATGPPVGPAEPAGAGAKSVPGGAEPVAVQPALPGMPPRLYLASPTRLLTWLDCPRRYRFRYLDRPRPPARPARAHTQLGAAVHTALARWWDLPAGERTPAAGARLVGECWLDGGFRSPEQSAQWRQRFATAVADYLAGPVPAAPLGIERVTTLKSGSMAITGRIDRLDDRDGDLVIVDYKTGLRRPDPDAARTSLPLALYAAAVWKAFRRPCLRVELHHIPTGEVLAYTHTPQSLERKVEQARSIVEDLRRADADYARQGVTSTRFDPAPSVLCRWCDDRAHCEQGQLMGPEMPSWAALEQRSEDSE